MPCPEPEPAEAETVCTEEVVSAGSINIVAPGAAAVDLGAPGECTGKNMLGGSATGVASCQLKAGIVD